MRIPTHPGDILKRELETIGLSAHALSMASAFPPRASTRSSNAAAP
jgi:plasmid maintenance system antidote protein VapI